MSALLYAISFASGVSALAFELLWFRQAGLAFGNSVWASSLVLSAFMGGLATGNAAAARYGDRLGHPVRAYAVAESLIALTGVGLVYLLPSVGVTLAPWLGPVIEWPWVVNPLRLIVAFLLLLIPSTAMGVTLPLLTRALVGRNGAFGAVLGRLYGWNTLGAVVGVVTGEMYLIGALGVRGTALAAAAVNVLAAAVALWLSTRLAASPRASDLASGAAPGWSSAKRWMAMTFVAGFCLLALEVVWFRLLLLVVEGFPTTFALMLGIVLAGIALGGLVASMWLGRSPEAHRSASAVALLAGALTIGCYRVFPWVLRPFAEAPAAIGGTLDILRVGAPIMFPVSFLSGMFFTLVGAALRPRLASEVETVGVLTLANTSGAALGSLVGGFVLLPMLGTERSLLLVAMLYGMVGVLTLRASGPAEAGHYLRSKKRTAATIVLDSVAVLVIGVAIFPFGSMNAQILQVPVQRWLRVDASARVAAVREGLTETVIYLETVVLGQPASYRMLANSLSMSTTGFGGRRYQKLYVYWPLAVNPHLKHALLIAYGVGNTAKAMTDTQAIESIDIVDVSRDIMDMNAVVYPNRTENPLHDPRVRVHVEDGRYFLQVTGQRFDLITGEPPPPHNAGVESLYTREYFQLLFDRLAEGGIVTYWLPIDELSDVSSRAILRAFCDVFTDCSLWNGTGTNLMMVGLRHSRGGATEEEFSRQWNDPRVGPEMRRLGLEQPEQLGALFIGEADYVRQFVGDSAPLVDDYPRLISAPMQSKEVARRSFKSLTDVAAARERFRRSSLAKRLWPERLLSASLPFFDFQETINSQLYGLSEDPSRDMEQVHRLLTRSDLRAPVLWLLGSDPDLQRILANASAADRAQPMMQYHQAASFMSERQYAAAVEPLRQSEDLPAIRDAALRLRVYALCMAGQTAQAQQLVHERFAQIMGDGVSLPFWIWIRTTFGVHSTMTGN